MGKDITPIVKLPEREFELKALKAKKINMAEVYNWILKQMALTDDSDEEDIIIHRDNERITVFRSSYPDDFKLGLKYLKLRYAEQGYIKDLLEQKNEEKR
jgi:hypothetical protein